MANRKDYVIFEGEPEITHLLSSAGDGEFTICGIAMDIVTEEPGLGRQRVAGKAIVNCKDCSRAIEHFKRVKIERKLGLVSSRFF